MANFKLGDRLTIPGKNLKGEIAFIGETHFSDDVWFGVILDEPKGKHNGIIEGKCYFKCPKNHGMFIKNTHLEKECYRIDNVPNSNKRCSLIRKATKFQNDEKAKPKLKAENNLGAPKSSTRKAKPHFQNRDSQVLGGDNVTNTNAENMQVATIAESGDNSGDGKKYPFVRCYPNYLKASSKLTGSHYCLKKNIANRTHNETAIRDRAAQINDKNSVSPTIDEIPENATPKRIIYRNYLKASSKLTRKHFCCDKNKTDHETMYDGGIKNTCENTAVVQTLKGCTEDISISKFSHSASNLMKYPYPQKHASNFKEKRPCSAKRIEMPKNKSPSKNEDLEITKVDHIQETVDQTAELEALKKEKEDLKNKLQNAESALQEILCKFNKAEEEIKQLSYHNDCQKKQIKFQKGHLKLLKMQQGNHYKKVYSFDTRNRNSNEKKIDQVIESILNEDANFDANASDKKFDLESIKATTYDVQHVLELEEKNRLMFRGLLELREFLKTQCEFESLNVSKEDPFSKRSSKKSTFPESFGSPPVLNSKAFAPDESTAEQLKEYSEMLREMTKYNEVLKGKRKYVKDWDKISFMAETLKDTDLPPIHDSYNINQLYVQSAQNILWESTFDKTTENCIDPLTADLKDHGTFENVSTLMKHDNQKEVIENSQYFSGINKINGNIHRQHEVDGVTLESVDDVSELDNNHSSNEPIYNDLVSSTIAALDDQGKESAGNSNSKHSRMFPGFPLDLRKQSSVMAIKSSDHCPIVLPKSKRSARKTPLPNKFFQTQEMGSTKK